MEKNKIIVLKEDETLSKKGRVKKKKINTIPVIKKKGKKRDYFKQLSRVK